MRDGLHPNGMGAGIIADDGLKRAVASCWGTYTILTR